MSDPLEPAESAIVVGVPAAEGLVSRWRRLYDPAATWGVPAHVTVLYPFVPPRALDEAVFDGIQDIATNTPRFQITLDAVDRFGDEVLYLRPSPQRRFADLTARFFKTWPDCPPYGGIHDEVIPHLTVAAGEGREHFDEIEADVSPSLPVAASVDSLWLMTGSMAPDSWRTVKTFPLA